MKVNLLDAHDRYQHLINQDFDISACCQNMIDKRPFGNRPFYIFAHARTDDDGVRKRLIWQPRLTKPKAQSNSMLFKGYPGTDIIKIVWMIPARELWAQYKYGTLCQNQTVVDSIHAFEHDRAKLEASDPEDLSDEQAFRVYTELSREANEKKATV